MNSVKGKSEMLVMEFVDVDDWSRPVYRDNRGRQWIDVNCGEGEPDLHRSTDDLFLDGEPDWRIEEEYEIASKYEPNPQKFQYMLLNRMQMDCKSHITAFTPSCMIREERIPAFIAEMKELWNVLVVKPEWLSMEEINRYETEMLRAG